MSNIQDTTLSALALELAKLHKQLDRIRLRMCISRLQELTPVGLEKERLYHSVEAIRTEMCATSRRCILDTMLDDLESAIDIN